MELNYKKLRELRDKNCYQQDEVVDWLKQMWIEITLHTYSRWETGKNKPLKKHIRSLSQFFWVEPKELMKW